ncbi:Chalcone synthase [Diplonema papillatum]|nr:Chalcone synthase [Diplonema papillatum]KAJ9454405.1 Chalcone synthase [Diplonema papillatum]
MSSGAGVPPAAFIAGWALSHPPLISNRHAMGMLGEMMKEFGHADEVYGWAAAMAGALDTRSWTAAWAHGTAPTAAADYLGKPCGQALEHELRAPGRDLTAQQRNRLWEYWAKRMTVDAAGKALERWGGDRRAVSHVVTTATSGWTEPGLSANLVCTLGLSEETAKQELNFNGCFCGQTCLRLARDLVMAGHALGERRVVLVAAVENASIQVSLADGTRNGAVCHSLFSDGAAAFVVAPEGVWEMTSAGMAIVPNSLKTLTMTPVAQGTADPERSSFHMVLSPQVGPMLAEYFQRGRGHSILTRVFGQRSWSQAAAKPALAVHPGGPRILDVLDPVFQKCFGFGPQALRYSYATMRKFGNLGCAASLFVLVSVFETAGAEDSVLALAFGPGVTVEHATFQRAHPTTSDDESN